MKEKSSVLVVDDESQISEAVAAYLQSKNYKVYTAETGGEALEIFSRSRMNFVILDLMLPDISGEDVCRAIRKSSDVPIIMLTAKSQEEDILRGLNIGADDYIVKPFSLKQLYARMEVISRRYSGFSSCVYSFFDGDLQVNFDTYELYKKGKPVTLTSSEWKVLALLIKRPNVVFTREQLVVNVLGEFSASYDRAIDTHIKNLRKKIEDDSKSPRYILTVWGSGYKFGGKS